MQKLIFSYFFTLFSIAIASTTFVVSTEAQSTDEYIDNTSPQVIEKMSGNIITFRNVAGEPHDYYVLNWMFTKYDLKIGSLVDLYNRNVIQGIYRDKYMEDVSPSLLNMNAFALHNTRSDCIISQQDATEGLASGKRVWFKSKDCPSTIPIVGAMSFYQPKPIAFVEQTDRSAITSISAPNEPKIVNEQAPVQGLW